MKKPNPFPPPGNEELELALARSLHRLRDAEQLLSDALPLSLDMSSRTAMTEVIGTIQTLKRRLVDLLGEGKQ
jgi:hypothetical protein